MLVLAKLLLVSVFPGPGVVDLILCEQGLGVMGQHPHQQLLAFTAKGLVGKQRLGHTFAVVGVGLVIEQGLLHGERRTITVVIAVFVAVAAIIHIGGLGVVAALVVVVREFGQQTGTAYGTAFLARIPLLDGTEEFRVIAQRQFVDLERAQCLGAASDACPQVKTHGQPCSRSHDGRHPSAHSAQSLRDRAVV